MLLQSLRIVKNSFLDFIYPPSCYFCGNKLSQERLLCTTCESEIEYNNKLQCPICDKYFDSDSKCPKGCESDIDFYLCNAGFSSAMRELIHMLKYSNRPDIGFKLGSIFGRIISDMRQLDDFDFLLPIPIYSTRKRERGYNQSESIAMGLSEILMIPSVSNAVIRNVPTKTQTKLNHEERQNNVQNIFKIKKYEEIRGKNIIIVDDVITSGATVKSLALELKNANANKICALALSRPNYNESKTHNI